MSENEAAALLNLLPQEALPPLDPVWIPEKLAKHTDPVSPAPARLMGAKAMVPMSPRDTGHVVNQCMRDPEPKIAQVAKSTFAALDDRILTAVLGDKLAPPVLLGLAITQLRRPANLERVLLNQATPDDAFVFTAQNSDDANIITLVAGTQARLLRCHDIVRALAANAKALRSEIDRAVDFLVREGIFLDDVAAFEDSFMRLGKADMLQALRNVKLDVVALTAAEQKVMAEHGLSYEQVIDADESVNELLEAAAAATGTDKDLARTPLSKLSIPVQIKLALTGKHARALEALGSTNKMVAYAGILNPSITE
ncbi:MAG: hypothetical protein ACO3JL_19750, partial [Myxococcota bacterium]